MFGLLRKRKGQSKGQRKKILFVTDLHGSEYGFRKLIGALGIWKPDVFIFGGDVAGKGLLPVLVKDDRARIRWMGEEHDVSIEELPQYEEKAKQLGFYPYRGGEEELRNLQDPDISEQIFEKLMFDRWKDWIERLEARCGELQIPTYVMAGNDDPWSLDELMYQEREWVKGADGRVLPLSEDWVLLTCGLANQTPWDCPRDISEEKLTVELEKMAEEISDFTSVIANIHVPPFGSSLDIAPELDKSTFPPRAVAGSTVPVGSTAVADFIVKHQPLLSLHGHIHESPGAVNIGRTMAINPGSEYAEGVVRGVLVTVEPDRVVGHQFVTG